MCFCCDVCDHAANLRVGYTPSTCLDDSRIVYMNDEAVLAMMSEIAGLERQAIAKVRGAKKRFEDATKFFGYNYDADNLFLDDDLQRRGIGPISTCMYDWFHIYVISGAFNYEFVFLLMFLSKNEDASILTNMGDFVHSWVYPKSHKQPTNIIGDVSLADHDHVKCDGAVSLQIAPTIAVYLMCSVHGCVAQVGRASRCCVMFWNCLLT